MTWCCVECGFCDKDSEKVTSHLMVEHKYPREVAELSAVFVAEDAKEGAGVDKLIADHVKHYSYVARKTALQDAADLAESYNQSPQIVQAIRALRDRVKP